MRLLATGAAVGLLVVAVDVWVDWHLRRIAGMHVP